MLNAKQIAALDNLINFEPALLKGTVADIKIGTEIASKPAKPTAIAALAADADLPTAVAKINALLAALKA